MRITAGVRGWICAMVAYGIVAGWTPAFAGKLEDMLLENKQITMDQWIKLKAEEEKRQAKELEESRGVGDTPVRERWYEKISIRGYVQFRYNHVTQNELLRMSDDRSIGGNNEFFLRRGRLVISGQPHDRVFFYFQPDFANLINGTEGVGVVRDLYADLFLTQSKEWRIRVGLSKVPFGFEDLQSSSKRLTLDRNDATNSGVPGQRDLGLFLYYTPTVVRDLFRRLVDTGLKGSGDYGMLGIGVYNGQGSNIRDGNKDKHIIFHSMYPYEFPNGQILQVGMDAYTGQYNVAATPVVPGDLLLTNGGEVAPRLFNNGNYLDERIGFHAVLFPQPLGIQAEYTFGRGPQLNAARTDVESGTLRGGYVQVFYKYDCDMYCQSIIPFFRVQEYYGGRKSEANAPHTSVREWQLGLEYQLNRALELTVSYAWAQGNSTDKGLLPSVPHSACSISVPSVACTQTPYQRQTGNLLRFQLQWNF